MGFLTQTWNAGYLKNGIMHKNFHILFVEWYNSNISKPAFFCNSLLKALGEKIPVFRLPQKGITRKLNNK
jgi:hypothetical protein